MLARVHALFVVFHESLLAEAVPGVKLIPGDGDDAVLITKAHVRVSRQVSFLHVCPMTEVMGIAR